MSEQLSNLNEELSKLKEERSKLLNLKKADRDMGRIDELNQAINTAKKSIQEFTQKKEEKAAE